MNCDSDFERRSSGDNDTSSNNRASTKTVKTNKNSTSMKSAGGRSKAELDTAKDDIYALIEKISVHLMETEEVLETLKAKVDSM